MSRKSKAYKVKEMIGLPRKGIYIIGLEKVYYSLRLLDVITVDRDGVKFQVKVLKITHHTRARDNSPWYSEIFCEKVQ